ncbi:hypothetical protein V5799_032019 [Amblyomma americanum]|uniref:Uncharacterized protein n=1 Tax=Amblyomma americanum TaxID=6943 RepID=A0AAQ4DSD2_AMBAM
MTTQEYVQSTLSMVKRVPLKRIPVISRQSSHLCTGNGQGILLASCQDLAGGCKDLQCRLPQVYKNKNP